MVKASFNMTVAMLLLFSMALPTVWQLVKVILLGFGLLLAITVLAQIKAPISITAVASSLVFVATGLIWATYGVIAGNPGAVPTMTVMVAYPLILPLLAYCYRESDQTKLHKAFILIGLLIAALDLAFIALSIISPGNAFSAYIFDLYEDNAVIDDADDYFKFTIPNISTCIFLLPFLITSAIHSQHLRKSAIIASSLMLIVIILSGRRAAFIAPILAILVSHLFVFRHPIKFSFSFIRKSSLGKVVLFLITVPLTGVLFFQNFYGAEFYFERIATIIDFSSDQSNRERAAQFQALLAGIAEHPIVGAGAGAAANYSRSEAQPWAYELSYIAFIFQYGVVGFLIYATGITTLVWMLVTHVNKYGRGTFEFAYLTGFLSFLFANATNPYLGKFDYMWVIFIPLALWNRAKLQRKSYNTQPNRAQCQ